MPTTRLTQLGVERMRPPQPPREVTVYDSALPGFGVRISPKGRKVWTARFRVRGGKEVMVTLGTLATVPNISDARALARQAMQQAEAGNDPRASRRAAEEVTRVEKAAAALTFGALVERFIREHCERNNKPNTIREVRRILGRAQAAGWKDRPAVSITRGDVNQLVGLVAARRLRKCAGKTGALVEANAMLRCLRTCFRWGAAMDIIVADPTAGVLKPLARVVERDRVLSDDEIQLFWAGAEWLGWPFGPIGKLLILTAQRESEVAGMRRSEIDIQKATWTIPASRSKNGKAHLVHLSPLAREVIEAMPDLGEFLFSSNGVRPVVGFSNAKRRLDDFIAAAGRQDIAPWVWHDRRRTATTGMARLGIAPHVADRILNHTAGTIRGVAAVYNRFSYEPERKAALEQWAAFLERLVTPDSTGNIVAMRPRKPA